MRASTSTASAAENQALLSATRQEFSPEISPSRPRKIQTPWLPVATAAAASTCWSLFPGPSSFLFVLVAGLFVIAWFFFVLVATLNNAFRRRWRSATLRLATGIVALPLTYLAEHSGDYLHLALLYPRYRQAIAATPSRPVRFDWGDQAVTVLEGMQQRTLVYDESGKTSASSSQRDSNGFFITTRHLIGSFFLEDTASQ